MYICIQICICSEHCSLYIYCTLNSCLSFFVWARWIPTFWWTSSYTSHFDANCRVPGLWLIAHWPYKRVQGWRVLDGLPWGMGQTNMAEWKMPCKGALKWDMGKDTKIERTGLTHLKRRAFFFAFWFSSLALWLLWLLWLLWFLWVCVAFVALPCFTCLTYLSNLPNPTYNLI